MHSEIQEGGGPAVSEYGYIRVSGKNQKVRRQVIAMQEVGVHKRKIYADKQSGKDFNREHYKKLVNRLKAGDVLYIKSIDRLGRDYNEIGEQWRLLTKEMGVDIVVLDMPLLDTRIKIKGLIGTFIADLVLQVLSYVAQAERENILQRQREGIDAALKSGSKYGRPKKTVPTEFVALHEAWKLGSLSLAIGAKMLGVSKSTFRRWCLKANKDDVCFHKSFE